MYQELSLLDDHMLADIGITRSDLPLVTTGIPTPRQASNDNHARAA